MTAGEGDGYPIHLDAGARALDALDADEAAAFDAHLPGCESCRIELEEFRSTGALLASAVAGSPPAAIRARVMARIAELPQLPPAPAPGDPLADATLVPLRRAWYCRPITLLAAAAVVIVVVVGAVVLATRPTTQTAAVDTAAMQRCVAAAPDAHMMTPTLGTGGNVMMAHSCHAAVVRVDGLPALPAGQIYQLWVMDPSGARSVGMLGTEPSIEHPMVTAVRDDDTDIRVSVEPASGSAAPSGTPVWMVDLTS